MRRGLTRVAAGAVVVLLVAGLGGGGLLRQRYGATPADTRAHVEADTRSRVVRLAAALGAAARDAGADAARVERAAGGDAPSVSALFADVALAGRPARAEVAALTVYGTDGVPLAWDGRPSALPGSRLAGPATTFLLRTPLGLRLVSTLAVVAAGSSRRVGLVAAEAAMASPETGASAATWPGAIVPVEFGPAPAGTDTAFAVSDSDGTVVGTARIAPAAVDLARETAWRSLAAWLWLIGALSLALLIGPLADWRTLARTTTGYLLLSGLVAVATIAAAGLAAHATTLAGQPWAGDVRRMIAALAALALAALAQSTLARWLVIRGRRSSRSPRRAVGAIAAIGVAAALGVAATRHHALLSATMPEAVADAAHFSLAPIDVARLATGSALVMLHAALLLGLAAAARMAVALVAPRWRPAPWLASVAALVVGGAVAWAGVPGDTPARAAAAWLALGVIALAAAVDGIARVLRRGSQPARLLVAFAALAVPAVIAYPSIAVWAGAARRADVAGSIAPQVAGQRQELQDALRAALRDIDAAGDVGDLVQVPAAAGETPVPADAAFLVWVRTALATRRLTSSVELYDGAGRMTSRFALNLPETGADQAWREAKCTWEIFEEVSPFFAEERRLLHAGRGVCVDGQVIGSVVVHVVLDYANLPFLSAQNPYVALMGGDDRDTAARDDVAFVVYGWSRRPLFVSSGEAWTLPEPVFGRLETSREPFWATIDDRGAVSDVFMLSDRGAIYAIGIPRLSLLAHLSNLAELVALTGVLVVVLLATVSLGTRIGGRVALSGRALLREVRASFSRTLFLAFVAAVGVPVVALALVTRTYMATSLRQDIEREAARTVASAARVIEDFASLESRGATSLPALDDSLLVWLSRVIGEDLDVFAGTGLLASSERNLFASGLLSTRTPGETYRALVLDGRPTYLARETAGAYEYRVASALVRVDDQQAIVSVPLTLRQRGIERQVDELDRRVLLAAIAFILLGSAIGYWAAERISDPVSRLTRATRRLAAGDLDAHVLVRTSDELGRLVEAFNGMADDLRRQRAQLERTNRLEAWAEMARQVAHDIKNPLTPIQLNAEHLRRVHVDRGQPLGGLVDDCVTNILLQVRLLRQLAAEFSSFASAPQARPAVTPIEPLLDEILAPYRTALAGRIAVAHEGAAGVTAHVDRVLLARALTNVIENALHAMPGTGSLVVRVPPPVDGRVRLEVIDTGVGMDAEALARIFEPYFSTKATGTGLGLTIARRNVELNGGAIEVASTPGVGTTVTLWVPADASGGVTS